MIGRNYTDGKTKYDLIGQIGFTEPVTVNKSLKKKVLITGAGSYIGKSFIEYVGDFYPNNYEIDEMDMLCGEWRNADFSKYDVVFHIAGIAHADVGKVSDDVKEKYYCVNTDLTVEVAKKAKVEGVQKFIFMSSMIIYGKSAPYGKKKVIDENTVPIPANFYGDSKLQADVAVRDLANSSFKVIVIRSPMIYGKGSKGNYSVLAKLAKKFPIFPMVTNERSMLYIDNLCEFLCQIMLIQDMYKNDIVLIPQNVEWTNTSEMVKEIAKVDGNNIKMFRTMKFAVAIGSKIPGKIGDLLNKAFGNFSYAHELSFYEGLDYQKVSLIESIIRTEGDRKSENIDNDKLNKRPRALILASVASMIEQFNMQNIQILLDLGYQVDVVCNCKKGNTISDERVESMIRQLSEKGVHVIHVPIPRQISNIKGILKSLEEVKKLCEKNKYYLLHCHSPIGSVIARFAARKSRKKYGTKIIYTAHGFHFYRGSPKQNWVIFYPIEKICSLFTDVLITINKEDYTFAQKHMSAGSIKYVPGIGIDTGKFYMNNFDVFKKKMELGLAEDDIVILSVGELNQNKNQEIVIKAIAKLNNQKVHYVIAGKGDKEQYLINLANKMNVNLHLLGYRTDIIELLNTADIFALPSFREGLSVALMEAMAAGLPCVVSKIRGNTDLIAEGKGGYLCVPNDVDDFYKGIQNLVNKKNRNILGNFNRKIITHFDINKITEMIIEIYKNK